MIVLLLAGAIHCQIDRDLFNNIGNMIRGETNIASLATVTFSQGYFYRQDATPASLNGVLGAGQTVSMGPAGNRGVFPFSRFKALLFGSNAKIATLVYENQVNAAGTGYVLANAVFGRRVGNEIQMRSAYGATTIAPKPQSNAVTVRVCHKKLFSKKCHDEVRHTPRGFYQHELDAIVRETERRAAISMRSSLGLGASAPELELGSLGSMFQHENNLLRTLYQEIVYEFTDIDSLELAKFPEALESATHGLLNGSLRQRIWEWVNAQPHLNFLAAANAQVLFFITAQRIGAEWKMHVSQFTIGAGRLPVGFLGITAGQGWNLERPGEAATPSIHQIAKIFKGIR